MCRRVLGDAHAAEDVFQATFLVLACRATSVRNHASLASWLYGVAWRLACKARAADRRRRARERQAGTMSAATPGDDTDRREQLALLDEELSRLPETYRAPLLLCELQGKTHAQAARELGWPTGSMSKRLARGRALLRDRLRRRGVTLPASPAVGVTVAAVPAALARATLRTALAADAASAAVVTLAEGMVREMFLARLTLSAAALALAGILAAGAGSLAHQAMAPAPRVAAGDGPNPDEDRRPRSDLYGDPLPDGAVARMGSARFRHAGLSDYVFLNGGKTLLTAGGDRALRFWDADTGRPTRVVKLQGTAGPGSAVTLSPDGKTLAAHDKDNIVLWDVDSGKEVKTLPGPKTALGYLYFSPDGKILAVGRDKRHVSFWEWQTGKERQIPLPLEPRPGGFFQGMDSTYHGGFSPDGKLFVAGASWSEPLGVFEADTGREVHRLKCYARASTVSPDGKRLAVSSSKNDQAGSETVVRLFDLQSGQETAQFPMGQQDSFYSLAFSPDGKTLACGFSDRSCLLDLTTGRALHRLSGRPIAMTFSPDGKTLGASTGHRLRFWDPVTGEERHKFPGEFGSNPVLVVSPDGRLLASADWMEQAVSLWDTAGGRLLRLLPLKGEGRYVRNLTFSADGQTLAAGQYKGFLQFWDVETGKERRAVQLDDPAHPNKEFVYFLQLHVSPDGQRVSTLERIFSQGESTRLAHWETTSGKLLHQQLFPGELRACAWSADGSTVALPLKEGLTLLEVQTGAKRFTVPGTPGRPLAASPDDRLLAAPRPTGGATEVGVWEIATGKEVAAAVTGRVYHLALAPDNRSLVTTDEGFLRVWDLATGKERRRWPLPETGSNPWGQTFVFALALSSDGRKAFTALADGTALVWDLTPALRPVEPLAKNVGEKEITGWWADLAGDDAGRACAAVWRLAEVPDGAAVSFLRQRVKPVRDADFEKVRKHIADLDSDTFEVREKAYKRLEELGGAAAPALRQALEKNPPLEVRRRLETLLAQPAALVRPPEVLRRLRAVQVLEQVASKEARDVLAELAGGADHAPETREAKAALERLSRQPAARP